MIDYAYLNTRVSAMRGHLISRAEIDEMLEFPDSGVIVDRLLDGPYELELVRALAIHTPLRALNRALDSNFSNTLSRILEFTGGESCTVLWSLLEALDVQCLKTIMRGVHFESGHDEIVDMIGPTARLTSAHVDELAGSPDIASVIALLQTWSVPWGDVLAALLAEYRNNHNLEPLEYALDCSRLESANRLGRSQNAQIAQDTINAEAEIANIIMCLKFSESGTQPPLLPTSGGPGNIVKKMVSAHEWGEAIEILAESRFSAITDQAFPLLAAEPGRFAILERLMDRLMLRESRDVALQNPLSVAVPYHYLKCKRNEIMNIRLIAHGIHNQVPTNIIRTGLIYRTRN